MTVKYAPTAIFNPTNLREGPIIAAVLSGTDSDSGWYRLCPDGVTAARPEDNQLMLDNRRADIDNIDLRDWIAILANDGYLQRREVIESDSGLITVKPSFYLQSRIADETLGESDIRYILMPQLLNPLNIIFDSDTSGKLEIGYSTEFLVPGVTGYSREIVTGETASPTIVTIASLSSGKSILIPASEISNLFYRFTEASDSNLVYWGEQAIIGSSGGGGGNLLQRVNGVPDADAASDGVIYIDEDDNSSMWYRGRLQIAAVDAVFTLVEYTGRGGGFDWQGSAIADPDVAVAADYYNSVNGQFRTKPAGALEDAVTNTILATAAVATGYTWLGVAATPPTSADQAFYFDSSNNQFYQKTAGNDPSTVTTSTFAPQGTTTQIGDWLGAFQDDTAATASLNYDVSHRQSYYQIQFNNFRQHSPGSATWFTVSSSVVTGPGQYRLLNPDAVDTEAELIAELDTTYNSARSYIYYDAADDELKDLDTYTVGDLWVLTEFYTVMGRTVPNTVWLGARFGNPGSSEVDTLAEVLAWFQANSYDSNLVYGFHNSVSGEIETVTFTAGVAWADISITDYTTYADAVLFPVNIDTEAELESYLENDIVYDAASDHYWFYRLSDTTLYQMTGYTAAIPASEEPLMIELGAGGSSGGGTGLNQTQVDARITALVQSWARSATALIPEDRLDLTALAWRGQYSETVNYGQGDIAWEVTDIYMSRIDNNLGQDPVTSTSAWFRINVPSIISEAESQTSGSSAARLISGERLVGAIRALSLTATRVVTEVTSQAELDAIITITNTAAFAFVTEAFGDYLVNDVLFYATESTSWVRFPRPTGTGGTADGVVTAAALGNDNVLTLTLSVGDPVTVDLSALVTASGADGVVTAAALGNDNVLTLTLSVGDPVTVDLSALVTASGADGVVTGATLSGSTVTITRSVGDDLTLSLADLLDASIYPHKFDRVYDASPPRTATNEVNITLSSGNLYDLVISEHTDMPEDFLLNIILHIPIKLTSGSTVWEGFVRENNDVDETTTSLRLDLPDRTGTFSDRDTIEISFGTASSNADSVTKLDRYLENTPEDLSDTQKDTFHERSGTDERIMNRIPFTQSVQLRNVDAISGTSGNRWFTAANLQNIWQILIYHDTPFLNYLETLNNGDIIQARRLDGDQIRTFTLTADAGSIQSGSVTLSGEWDVEPPTPSNNSQYMLSFTRSAAVIESAADGVITGISRDGNTITITRSVGDPLTLDVAGLVNDGVVTAAALGSDSILTLTLSVGDPVTVDLSDLADAAPIHYSSEIDSLDYVATLDGSAEQFTLTPVAGNQFDMTFSGLPDSDRRLTEDVLQGSVVGFFDGDTEVVLADVDQNYNSADGIRLTFRSAVTFSLTVTYTIKITQARRGSDSTASGTEAVRTEVLDTTTDIGGLTRVLFTLSADLTTFDEASDLQFVLWDGTLASPFHPIPLSLLLGMTRHTTPPTGIVDTVVARGARLGQISAVTAFADSNLYVSIQDGTHLWISGSGSGGTLLEPDRMQLYVAPRIGGEAQVDASGPIRERLPFPHSFELRYVDSNTGEGSNTRWVTALVSNVRNIGMRPPDNQSDFFESIESGDQMQVRDEDGTYRNTYTFSADASSPNTEGYFASIAGSWETTPDFTDETTYMLFFSRSPEVVSQSQLDRKLNASLDNTPSSLATDNQQSFQVRVHLPIQIDGDDITGTIDAIVLNIHDFPSEYGLGQVFHFTPDFASGNNTGNVTLQVEGLSTIALLRSDGSQIPPGELIDGVPIFATYDNIHDAFRADIEPPQVVPDVVGGEGASTSTNSDGDTVVTVDNPFTEEDEDTLDDLAGRSGAHPEDDLILSQSIGGQHFFDQRREVHGLALYDSDVYLLDDAGRVNDERIYATGSNVYGAARNALHWYFGHGDNVQVYALQNGVWVSVASRGTGVTNIRGVEMTIDQEHLDVMYILAEGTSTQMRIRNYDVSETAGTTTITQRPSYSLLMTDINGILTGAGLEALTEIYNATTNRGVSAIAARDNSIYLMVNGVGISGTQIPVAAILKIDTAGTGSSRVYTLDTNFIEVLHISYEVRGLGVTDDGYWIADDYGVSDYKQVSVEGGTGDVDAFSYADGTLTVGRRHGLDLTADVTELRDPIDRVDDLPDTPPTTPDKFRAPNEDGKVSGLYFKSDEDNPYFRITPQSLGDDVLGYSEISYPDLNRVGARNADAGFEAFYESYASGDNERRWWVRYGFDVANISEERTFANPSYSMFDSIATGIDATLEFEAEVTVDTGVTRLISGGNFVTGSDNILNFETSAVTIAGLSWRSSTRQFGMFRSGGTATVNTMEVYWGTGAANDQNWYSKSVFIRFADGTVAEIGRDARSGFVGGVETASWTIHSRETRLIEKLDGIAAGETIVVIVADRQSVDWGAVRLLEGNILLKFEDADTPLMMKPVDNSPYEVEWATDVITATESALTAGTAFDASLYDDEGNPLYTAANKRTMDIPLVLEKNAFPKYCHFYHEGAYNSGEDFTPADLYPDDTDVEESRRNFFRNRKFILGRVYSSTNNGLPLTELDMRTGARGDVDVHTGEDSTDDLIRWTVVRPDVGTWRFYANIDLLTRDANTTIFLRLLQIKSDADRVIDVVAEGAAHATADDDYLFPDDDGEPVGGASLLSTPIECDGSTDFVLIWGAQPASTQQLTPRIDWKCANMRWGFEMIGR